MKRLIKPIVRLWRVPLADPHYCIPCGTTRTWVSLRENHSLHIDGLVHCRGCGGVMAPCGQQDDPPWMRGEVI